jgi:hypothetical protein
LARWFSRPRTALCRIYTHYRGKFPKLCKCFHCLSKLYEEAMNREIWERVRLREAKRGNHLMSYDMKVEVEGKVGVFAWLAFDSLASPVIPFRMRTGVRAVDVGQERDAGGQVRARLYNPPSRCESPSNHESSFCFAAAKRPETGFTRATAGRASRTTRSAT